MVGTYFDHCWWGWGWGWGGVMGGQQQAAALPSLPCTSPPPLHSPSATPTLVLAGRAVLALLMLVVVMVIVVMVVVALLPRTLCNAGLAAVVCMPILCVAVAVVVAVMPLPPLCGGLSLLLCLKRLCRRHRTPARQQAMAEVVRASEGQSRRPRALCRCHGCPAQRRFTRGGAESVRVGQVGRRMRVPPSIRHSPDASCFRAASSPALPLNVELGAAPALHPPTPSTIAGKVSPASALCCPSMLSLHTSACGPPRHTSTTHNKLQTNKYCFTCAAPQYSAWIPAPAPPPQTAS